MDEWWNRVPLGELDREQWEALCDGCARCCLHKLQDGESGEVFYTGVHCRFLDAERCRCTEYERRTQLAPQCVRLTPEDVDSLDWLPHTCAYRVRARGEPLPEWHPLVTGDAESVHRAGISVRGRTVSEEFVHPEGYDEHIVRWVERGRPC